MLRFSSIPVLSTAILSASSPALAQVPSWDNEPMTSNGLNSNSHVGNTLNDNFAALSAERFPHPQLAKAWH